MQQSIVKFIALSHGHCSTCFGHYYAHHQEPVKLPLQPPYECGSRSVLSRGRFVSKPTTAENTLLDLVGLLGIYDECTTFFRNIGIIHQSAQCNILEHSCLQHCHYVDPSVA